MVLKDFRDAYYTASGKASDIARTLALSAIAIVWIFKIDTKQGAYGFAAPLLFVAWGAVIALTLDLLQYAWGALIWGAWCRLKERSGVKPADELDAPPWFNWPSIFFFWSKLIVIALVYGRLIAYLGQRFYAIAATTPAT
jgi:hypothetical protein